MLGFHFLTLRSRLRPILVLSTVVVAACGWTEHSDFDWGQLERDENQSESLANDLLALSVAVREQDFESVEPYLADRIQATPLPEDPPASEPLFRWIHRRNWSIDTPVEWMDRDRFRDNLEAFIGRLSDVEDVRFKVAQARFDERTGDHGEASLTFFVVGRDAAGKREWITGAVDVEVGRRADGPWRLAAFRLQSLESRISQVDLFSEVAIPAGVDEVFPAFGVGRNEGFVSHGAATADINGDGLLDLAASGVDQNYLYLNEGDGRFRDVSDESLVAFAPIGSGALFLDYDNDGDPDLFFAAVGQQVLLENRWIPDGELKFLDVSAESGVSRPAVGFSAAAADINRDGHPDIYVCSYNRYGRVMPNSWLQATNGTPNLLFVNQGDGTFSEAAAAWGVNDGRWSYAAGFVDIENDGDQDLYVANDFGENALFRNDGDRFTDVAASVGLEDSGFGMGVSFGDYDNDGDLDLHVTNMSSTAGNRILQRLDPEHQDIRDSLAKQTAGNSLYENMGDGRFRNVTAEVGGLPGGWAFGGGFLDFDNDGWEDIYTPNGFISGTSMKDT